MSNTNTEVLTTAYEKLQEALTQSNTVLPKLENAIESGDLQNYATTSQLEEKENKAYVTLEDFGAVGDGITDDTIAIQNALDSDYNIKILDKTYYHSDIVNCTKSKEIIGIGNATLLCEKNLSASNINYKSFVNFTNINGLKISNITIKSKFEWYERGYSDTNFNQYYEDRLKQANSIILQNCTNVIIENCTIGYGRVGVFVDNSNNVRIINSTLDHTMADGIFITNLSNDVKVINCHANYTNDDCFSSDGYEATKMPYNNHFVNCTAYRCNGHIVCFAGTHDCSATGFKGYEMKRFPIDCHNLHTTTPNKNLVVSDMFVTLQDDLIGLEQHKNGDDLICGGNDVYCDGVELTNITIKRNNNFYDSTLIFTFFKNVTFNNVNIEGFKVVFQYFENLELINSKFRLTSLMPFVSKDGIINKNLKIYNCDIYVNEKNTDYGVIRVLNIDGLDVRKNKYSYLGMEEDANFDVFGLYLNKYADTDPLNDNIVVDNIPQAIFYGSHNIEVDGVLKRYGLQSGSAPTLFKEGTQMYDLENNILYMLVNNTLKQIYPVITS